MPDLRQLRALKAVAESGSFSRAADALDYTQPAISKTIAGLEGELGAVLVERDCRPVRLTDAGAALVRQADEVFSRLSSAQAEIDAITRGEAGTLAIGTFGSAASAFVVQAVCDFRRRHPAISLSLIEGSPPALVRHLRAGDLDVAAIFDFPEAGDHTSDGLVLEHLLDQPFDVVLATDHPLAGHPEVGAQALADDDWVLPDLGHNHPMMRVINQTFTAAGFEPNVPFRVNDCRMTLAMVAAGGGVALLPRLLLQPLPPGVVARPLSGPAPRQRVAAARLPDRFMSPACSAFLRALRAAADHRVSSWHDQAPEVVPAPRTTNRA